MSEKQTPPHSASLADEEVRQVAERKEIISKTAIEIEKLLIREGINFREWQEICALFMDRQMRIAETLTIKEAKERFDNQ